ncbi:hypothetical protein [Paraburkholderia sp. SIMBA_054]|uniref:hypothetical protein n=1 Tax=Paraburkholderia sp. SIMBA_054 TaxID=3085795 RepID=UPI00397A4DB5
MTEIVTELTPRHFKRLHHYWQGGDRGGASMTDSVDLDLAAAGLIRRLERTSGTVHFVITSDGEKELAAKKARTVASRQPHHDFGSRVAAWRRDQKRVTWENIELLVEDSPGMRQAIRPDVFSLATTYDEKRINPCVDEIKVSRADFLADIARPEKREGYQRIAEVLYYAAPVGIIQPDDVPDGCGLLVEIVPGRFEIARRAKKRKVVLSAHTFMNLVLKPGTFNPLF